MSMALHRQRRSLAGGSPEAHQPFLGRDPPRLDARHRLQLVKEPHISEHKESHVGCSELGAEQHNAKKSARVLSRRGYD